MPVKRSKMITQLMRVPKIGGWVKKCHDPLLNLKFRFYNDYLLNPQSRTLFEKQNLTLSEPQQQVVDDLENNGIAMVNFSDLFGSNEQWDFLCKYVKLFAESPAVAERVESFKTDFEPTNPIDHKYLIRHFTEDQVIDWTNPMLQIGLESKILDVVNSYLRLWAKLKKIHLWYTIPLDAARPRTGPQNWHRDPEDQKMVTVFLYFTEVDNESGPLQYIPDTRFGGQHQALWPKYGGAGHINNVTEEEIAKQIPASEVKTCLCQRGTLVFCDTSGFHRGGFALKRPRIVAHWTYASPASLWPRRFNVAENLADLTINDQSKYALR